MLPTNSRIAKTYPKNFTPNPDQVHNNYERFQTEKFGNVLDGSEKEPEEDEFEELLSDFSTHDND